MFLKTKVFYLLLCIVALAVSRPAQSQACNTVYAKRYLSQTAHGIPRQLALTTDEKLLVTSDMRELPVGTPGNTTILKLDGDGGILAGKKIIAEDRINSITDNKRLKDGNFLLLDYLFNGIRIESKLALVKYDGNLNIIWTKTYSLPFKFSGNCRFVEDDDGTLFLYFQFSTGENGENLDYSAIAKLDLLGNLIWCNTYRLPRSDFFINGRFVQLGGYLYYSKVFPLDSYSTGLYKVDKATGNMVWVRRIALPNNEMNLSKDFTVLNGKIILLGGITTRSNIYRPALLAMNEDGTLTDFKSYSIPNGTIDLSAIEPFQNNLLVAGTVSIAGADHSVQMIIGNDLSVTSGLLLPTGQTAADIAVSTSGSQFETGVFYSNNFSVYDIFVRKRALDGQLGSCSQDPFKPNVVTENVTLVNTMTVNSTLTLALENMPVSFAEYSFLPVDQGCVAALVCTSITMTGAGRICKQDSIYMYKATRSFNCTTPVTWTFDATAFQQTAKTDSTLFLRPLRSGVSQVKATLVSDCRKDLVDSLLVTTTLSDARPELGNDRTLCTDSILFLRPGKQFASYIWQDGSVDSVYRVSAAGIYHLVVTDSCNIPFRDTIRVIADLPASLGLDPEATVCARDTLRLIARAGGFTGYQWTNTAGVIIGASDAISVAPGADTKYFLKAIKSNNCPAVASTNVRVLQSAVINLGADTSLCGNDSIRLGAGTGFTSYAWSTGSTLSAITVNRIGTYSVLAQSANGCFSKDTFVIRNVYANPIVSLGPDLKICTGEPQQISPGNFSGYQWQDGSTGRSFTVSQTGTYWVTVRDLHQCRGSDTINIVAADCLAGVYIPNAFSPNGNGSNDVFRAKVSGDVLSFQLTVYNRYGQKVFSTDNKLSGWDGKFNGRLQDPGGYVYMLQYQLPGGEPVLKKGVVMLVR